MTGYIDFFIKNIPPIEELLFEVTRRQLTHLKNTSHSTDKNRCIVSVQ